MQKSLERIDVLFAQCNCNSITDCSSQLSIFVSFCSERAQGPLRSLRTAVRSCEALLIGCNANSNRQTSSSSVIIIIISHHKIKSYSDDNHLIEAFKHYLHSSFLCWIGSRMARLHRPDIQQLDTHTQSHVQTSIWNRNQCNGIPLSRTWQRRQLVLCILIFYTGALIAMTSGLHRTKREKSQICFWVVCAVQRQLVVAPTAIVVVVFAAASPPHSPPAPCDVIIEQFIFGLQRR